MIHNSYFENCRVLKREFIFIKLERIKPWIGKIGNVGCGMMLDQSWISIINYKFAHGHNKQDLF